MASGTPRPVVLQVLLVAVTAVLFFLIYGAFAAASAVYGGAIACANRLLLEWRRHRADRGPALDAASSLRVLYRTALERFVLAGVLLALGFGVMQLDPLPLLTGFIVGQLAPVFTGNGKSK